MPTIISGDGTITGLTATGISAVQDLPAGSVLQVVNATYSTIASTTSSTYSDTGLTATITPKFATSKILAIASVTGIFKDTGNTNIALRLVRGSTSISVFELIAGYTGNTSSNGAGGSSVIYLDSPATTSATTYKVQFASAGNVASASINNYAFGATAGTSTITLMEIAG
jgi:hypothetical protein